MIVRNFSTWIRLLTVGVFLLVGAEHVQAQTANLDTPDWQFFAPAELPEFDQVPTPNTGWYVTWDRMINYAQRPDNFPAAGGIPGIAAGDSEQMDRGYGNRYDLGYMGDNGGGWLFNYTHLDGPNAEQVTLTERLNRARIDFDPDEEPTQDGNNRLTNGRDYFVTQSINVIDMNNWEFNRVFRFTPNNAGWTVEPIIGVRFIKLMDVYRSDSYLRFDDDGVIIPDVPPPTGDTATTEQFTSRNSSFTNLGFGGQIGARFWKKFNRINYSAELRVFALHNQQDYHRFVRQITTQGDQGLDNDTDAESSRITDFYAERSELMLGGDIRMEVAFEITRDVAARLGFNLMSIEKGLARGHDHNHNSQDFLMYGFNFGVTVNR